MSNPNPYHLTIGEDGLSVRCELDVHYLTDEQLETVRRHVETLKAENAKLRELVRDVVLLAGLNGCDVTKMQMHAHGGDWRTIWERMAELRVPGTEADHD